ncbi:hypothetical protein [Persephonella sp.]
MFKNLYKNKLIQCDMFYEGYKNYRDDRNLILSFTIDTDNFFSRKELSLFYDFLILLRCTYTDLKSIFWYPEVIFITFLIYLLGDNHLKGITLLTIFFLVSIFIFRLYYMHLLLVFFKKPLEILVTSYQVNFIDGYIERKLNNIISNLIQDGIRFPALKIIREFIPVLGR